MDDEQRRQHNARVWGLHLFWQDHERKGCANAPFAAAGAFLSPWCWPASASPRRVEMVGGGQRVGLQFDPRCTIGTPETPIFIRELALFYWRGRETDVRGLIGANTNTARLPYTD